MNNGILITGGAGFIGSHLVDILLKRTKEPIYIFDNFSTGNQRNIQHAFSSSQVQIIQGNVCDRNSIEPLFEKCHTVYHLAAAVGVKLIIEKPVATIETNVSGTETVLQLAKKYKTKVLLASTSEVYGKNTKIPFHEESDLVMGPTIRNRWSYACSKAIDEFLALAYHHEFGLPIVIVRFFNTVGPRQTGHYGMVLPRFIRQAMNEEPLTIYGDGTQTRCFGYVKEAVTAIYELMQKPSALGEIFNIGSQEQVSINQLAKLVKEVTQSSSNVEYIPYEKVYGPHFEDMKDRYPDTSKLFRFLGWRFSIKLDEIIQESFEFEKTHNSSFMGKTRPQRGGRRRRTESYAEEPDERERSIPHN
ncbi:MAG: GDP-mannose 4,6-dehydratase [Deltaproteobacteria bacterium]|nr:GDP-mannose 4,6-dehydratase [Deltaproteobacteria bacterium]